MSQVIVTKYLGPTNTRGARIKATCYSSSVTIPYPHESSNPHAVAAEALKVKLGWTGTLIGGGLPDSTGYAFVFAPEG